MIEQLYKKGDGVIVADFMTKNVISCHQDQTVEEAAKVMIEHNFSCLPVVDDQHRPIGIITETDFVGREVSIPHALASVKALFKQNFYFGNVEEIYKKSMKKKIKTIMTHKLYTVPSTVSLSEAVKYLIRHELKRSPVVDNGKLVGIITRKDMIRAFDKVVHEEK